MLAQVWMYPTNEGVLYQPLFTRGGKSSEGGFHGSFLVDCPSLGRLGDELGGLCLGAVAPNRLTRRVRTTDRFIPLASRRSHLHTAARSPVSSLTRLHAVLIPEGLGGIPAGKAHSLLSPI